MRLWVLIHLLLPFCYGVKPREHHRRCEVITYELCSDLPYNTTR